LFLRFVFCTNRDKKELLAACFYHMYVFFCCVFLSQNRDISFVFLFLFVCFFLFP
jgi:hypothetical protein